MSEPIVVATPFQDLGELSEHFAQRVDGGRLMLPYPAAVDEAAWVQFQVLYADGSVALEGTGKVSGAYDNGEEHPPEYRFDIVLEELSLDGTSEVVFERIVVARDSMLAADPGTGEVSIAELEAQEPAPAPVEEEIPEAISGLEAMGEGEESSSGFVPAFEEPAAEEAMADDVDAGFVEASTTVGHISSAPPPPRETAPRETAPRETPVPREVRRAAPAVAPAAAPAAAPRANPGGAPTAPGTLPTPHSFAQGVLTRPVLDPVWAPTPDVRPDPAAASGLFEYTQGLPKPARPPRPELPEGARVGHAPAPTAG